MLMNILRRLGLALCAAIFSLSVFLFALFVSVYFVFDTPKATEAALQQSGIYSVAAEDLVEQTQTNSNALPLNDSGVKAALQAGLPPQTVQSFTEQIVNSTYAWVHGQTTTPNFSIDLTSTKQAMADNLATYVQQKVSALPVCSGPEAVPPDASEVLQLTCRPPELSVSALVSQVRQQVLGSGIIKDSTITTNSVKNAQGVPLSQEFSYVPKAHRYFVWSLLALPGVIALSALGVLFLARSKRAGVRRLSFTLITTGIYSIAIALLSAWGLNRLAGSLAGQGTGLAALQSSFVKVADILATDLRGWWLGFGVGYVVLGVIGMVIVHVTKPKLGVVPKGNPLEHNLDIPAAGETFAPKDGTSEEDAAAPQSQGFGPATETTASAQSPQPPKDHQN